MKTPLISENDYKALSSALRRMEPLTLVRTLGREKITASVVEVGRPWPVAVAIHVVYENKNITWRQTFESIEEMRRRM